MQKSKVSLIISCSRNVDGLCRFSDIFQLAFRFQPAELPCRHALGEFTKRLHSGACQGDIGYKIFRQFIIYFFLGKGSGVWFVF